jgi:hypothetical protein
VSRQFDRSLRNPPRPAATSKTARRSAIPTPVTTLAPRYSDPAAVAAHGNPDTWLSVNASEGRATRRCAGVGQSSAGTSCGATASLRSYRA